jgi:hypothetical protein
MNKARIRAIEKRLGHAEEYGPMRVWFTYSHNDEEDAGLWEQITSGKVRHADGGFYRPGNQNVQISIRYTGAPGEVERESKFGFGGDGAECPDKPKKGRGHAD